MNKIQSQPPRRSGFTLIELLTVIAIIGILAGILIPTTGTVLDRVRIARSKNTFNGYANALLQYRSEYGSFPSFLAGGAAVDLSSPADHTLFHIALSGRDENGNAPTNRSVNRKLISFYNFTQSDYAEGTNQLADAFGNTNIFVACEPSPGQGIPVGEYIDKDGATVTSGQNLNVPVAIYVSELTDPAIYQTIRSWD